MINRQYVPIVRHVKSIWSCKRPELAHQVRRLSTGEFDIFKKLKDSTNPEESKDDARKPSDKVIKLVDEILNLTLIEAADLCDLCQEKLAERNGPAFNNGFIPGRTPFPHPHTFFSGTPPLGDYNVTGMGMVSPGMAQMGAGMPMGVAPGAVPQPGAGQAPAEEATSAEQSQAKPAGLYQHFQGIVRVNEMRYFVKESMKRCLNVDYHCVGLWTEAGDQMTKGSL